MDSLLFAAPLALGALACALRATAGSTRAALFWTAAVFLAAVAAWWAGMAATSRAGTLSRLLGRRRRRACSS